MQALFERMRPTVFQFSCVLAIPVGLGLYAFLLPLPIRFWNFIGQWMTLHQYPVISVHIGQFLAVSLFLTAATGFVAGGGLLWTRAPKPVPATLPAE